MFLAGVILSLVLVGVGGCSQPQVQPQVKSKPASKMVVPQPSVVEKQEAQVKAEPKKEIKVAKAVTQEEVSKPKVKEKQESEELYVPEVKPMKPAECGRCHINVYKTLLNEGGKHKFDCTNCHQVFHVFRAAEIWDQIVPKCTRCHGYYHGEEGILKDCQKCHIEAHAPKRIPLGDILDLNCGKCHPKIIGEMKQFPSKHSQQKCSLCHHTKHGYIPSCMECHEPHVASLKTNQQCLECHPVHSPTRPMIFKAGTSNEICSACHSDEVERLAANKSKHHNVACVDCHTKHGYIPKCQECHEQPHGQTLLKKFPNCLDCHIDPHNLPTKGKTTKVSAKGK